MEAGHLEIILGPMYSGKTTELLRRLSIHEVIGKKVHTIKHSSDDRYDTTQVVSHGGWKRKASVTSSIGSILPIEEDVIGIDEGQFFPDLYESCKYLIKQGKIVIVSSLDGDYKMNPIGDTLTLIPFADNVEKLRAICTVCKKREAPFTVKKSVGSGMIEVGGSELYYAACRECYTCPE